MRADPNYNLHTLWLWFIIPLTGIFNPLADAKPQNPQNMGSQTHPPPKETTATHSFPLIHQISACTQEITGSFPFSKMAALFPQHWFAGLEQFPHQPIICGILITGHTLPYISIITPFCPLMRIFQDKGGHLTPLVVGACTDELQATVCLTFLLSSSVNR